MARRSNRCAAVSLRSQSQAEAPQTRARSVGEATAAGHCFETWLAERSELNAQLNVTPETNEKARDKIFDRCFQIERLIVTTPCFDLPAIRAKAGLLLWYMEMEQADGLPAMRQIKEYLDRFAEGAPARTGVAAAVAPRRRTKQA